VNTPSVVDPITERRNHTNEFATLMGMDLPFRDSDVYASVCVHCSEARSFCKSVEVAESRIYETWCMGCIGMWQLRTKSWKASGTVAPPNPSPTPTPAMNINSPWGTSR
jgi:hypothetical protein